MHISKIASIASELRKLAETLRGYKVMRVENGELVSGANSRLRIPLKVGTIIQMPAPGLYLSLDKEYVMTYYSGLADEEAVLTLAFDSNDITKGNLTDRETEIAVSKAIIEKFELVTAADVQSGEPPRFVVERVYTDDGDATEDYRVYDTKQKKVVLEDGKDRASAVARQLNQKTDSKYIK